MKEGQLFEPAFNNSKQYPDLIEYSKTKGFLLNLPIDNQSIMSLEKQFYNQTTIKVCFYLKKLPDSGIQFYNLFKFGNINNDNIRIPLLYLRKIGFQYNLNISFLTPTYQNIDETLLENIQPYQICNLLIGINENKVTIKLNNKDKFINTETFN